MRFVVDECTGPAVADWLRSVGHDLFSVFHQARGATDEEVLRRAVAEERVLITNDKDFGERIFRDGEAHKGVIFLRLTDERSQNKIARIQQFLDSRDEELFSQYVVVTESNFRIVGVREEGPG